MHGTLRFLNLSHLLYGICVNIFIMKSVYFKEPHNEREYYCPTIYRAGKAVVSTITSALVCIEGYFSSSVFDKCVVRLTATRAKSFTITV